MAARFFRGPTGRILQRVVGGALLLVALLPLHRLLLLDGARGPEAEFIRVANGYGVPIWVGGGAVLVAAVVVAALVGPGRVEGLARRAGRRLSALPGPGFAAALALLSGGLTLLFSLRVLEGKPNLVDAAAQLTHARYLAAGRWAGPALPDGGFWDFQYMLETAGGWVSQYPPAHPVLLALGLRLGGPWLVGPVLMAVTVFFTARVADGLFSAPRERAVGRLGAVLLATSPLLVGLSGAQMSHVTPAAFAAVAAWAALRAHPGGGRGRAWGWALVAGAAVGMAVLARPLSGLLLGAAATLGVWWAVPEEGKGVGRGGWSHRLGGLAAGGAPFAALFALYNRHFFGSPLQLGYVAAQGPRHGLGFHEDPWGRMYGPVEAVGYTAGELRALGLDLVGTPLSAVAVVGIFLLVAPAVGRRVWLLLAWSLVPVLAAAFYWHHDLFMGPRMISETAPAWCLLVAMAAVGLVRLPVLSGEGRARFRAGVILALVLSGAAAWVYTTPRRLLSHGSQARRAGWHVEAPTPPGGPALVFVHGSWQGRLGARMAALEIREDSIRSALAYNATCRVERVVAALETSGEGRRQVLLGALRFEPEDGGPPASLRPITLPSGSVVLVVPGEELPRECRREGASDTRGVVGLPQLLWQGDLPGLPGGGAMFVRDLGPGRNARLRERFPDRTPWLLVPASPGASPSLFRYEEAMEVLWELDAGEDGANNFSGDP